MTVYDVSLSISGVPSSASNGQEFMPGWSIWYKNIDKALSVRFRVIDLDTNTVIKDKWGGSMERNYSLSPTVNNVSSARNVVMPNKTWRLRFEVSHLEDTAYIVDKYVDKTVALIGAKATINVDTTPVKGTVLVNGVSYGTAPVSFQLDAGTYTVSFSGISGYYTPSTQTITVSSGETRNVVGEYAVIPPAKATINIDTTPVKGEVILNGVSQGIAPLSLLADPGTYSVSFGNVAGYATPPTQIITVVSGEIKSVLGEYVAVPLKATINVDTTPVKGTVFLDDTSQGMAPISVSVDAGNYNVSFGDMPGYNAPSSQDVTVSSGEVKNILGTYTTVGPPTKYFGDTVNVDVQFKNTGPVARTFQVTGQMVQGTQTAQTQVEALINPGETLTINPAVQVPTTFVEDQSCDVVAILRDKETLKELDREPNPDAVYIGKSVGATIIGKVVG